MLYWTSLFFVIALVSALVGFTTITLAIQSVAQIVFYIFAVLFVVSLILLLTRRSKS